MVMMMMMMVMITSTIVIHIIIVGAHVYELRMTPVTMMSTTEVNSSKTKEESTGR